MTPRFIKALRWVLIFWLADERRHFEETEEGKAKDHHIYHDLVCIQEFLRAYDANLPSFRLELLKTVRRLLGDLTKEGGVEINMGEENILTIANEGCAPTFYEVPNE